MNRVASKRVFVAINLPVPVKDRLRKIQEQAQRLGLPCRLTSRDNLHLTLIFLGSQPMVLMETLKRILNEVVRVTPDFDLTPERWDIFRENQQLASWHLSVRADRALNLLYQKLVQRIKAAKIVFSPDREFKPHITLGRFRTKSPDSLPLEKLLAEPVALPSFSAGQLALMESDLKFQPPKYRLLIFYPFSKSS